MEQELCKSYVYRIRTRSGQQKFEREHVMTYLGEDLNGDLTFNARPFAGTQTLRKSEIVSIAPMRPSDGRDDQGHYMNKVIRG
jgi:hypothetical protein